MKKKIVIQNLKIAIVFRLCNIKFQDFKKKRKTFRLLISISSTPLQKQVPQFCKPHLLLSQKPTNLFRSHLTRNRNLACGSFRKVVFTTYPHALYPPLYIVLIIQLYLQSEVNSIQSGSLVLYREHFCVSQIGRAHV